LNKILSLIYFYTIANSLSGTEVLLYLVAQFVQLHLPLLLDDHLPNQSYHLKPLGQHFLQPHQLGFVLPFVHKCPNHRLLQATVDIGPIQGRLVGLCK